MKYTPPIYKDRKRVEFLELRQGSMTVTEYELQFERLSRYAAEETFTDIIKRDRFERGLKAEIRDRIAARPPSYAALLETALRAEDSMAEISKRQRTSEKSGVSKWHKGSDS